MAPVPDHYAVLGVRRDAGLREISRAYRTLMRSHHPDMDNGASPEGELLRIMQAFNVLRDPQRRAAYDKQLSSGAGQAIPVRKVHRRPATGSAGPVIRVTPVRWESGPWS